MIPDNPVFDIRNILYVPFEDYPSRKIIDKILRSQNTMSGYVLDKFVIEITILSEISKTYANPFNAGKHAIWWDVSIVSPPITTGTNKEVQSSNVYVHNTLFAHP